MLYMMREAVVPPPVDPAHLKVDHSISNYSISEFIFTAIVPYFCFPCTEQAAAPQL